MDGLLKYHVDKYIRYVRINKYHAKHVHGACGHIPALSGWSVWPAALRRPQKNDVLGFVEHVYCQFS